jgi:hypothetical protein
MCRGLVLSMAHHYMQVLAVQYIWVLIWNGEVESTQYVISQCLLNSPYRDARCLVFISGSSLSACKEWEKNRVHLSASTSNTSSFLCALLWAMNERSQYILNLARRLIQFDMCAYTSSTIMKFQWNLWSHQYSSQLRSWTLPLSNFTVPLGSRPSFLSR